MKDLHANVHAMVMEGFSDEIIKRIVSKTFPDIADCIDEQINKVRQLLS